MRKTEYFYETGSPSIVTADIATGVCRRRYPRGGIKPHISTLTIGFWRDATRNNPINFKRITRAKARLLLKTDQAFGGLPLP